MEVLVAVVVGVRHLLKLLAQGFCTTLGRGQFLLSRGLLRGRLRCSTRLSSFRLLLGFHDALRCRVPNEFCVILQPPQLLRQRCQSWLGHGSVAERTLAESGGDPSHKKALCDHDLVPFGSSRQQGKQVIRDEEPPRLNSQHDVHGGKPVDGLCESCGTLACLRTLASAPVWIFASSSASMLSSCCCSLSAIPYFFALTAN